MNTVFLPYRAGVGVMLVARDGRVLVGRRIDNPVDAWQMPQGGLDVGEEPREAALRELEEETGVPPRLVDIVAETEDWLNYDLPPELVGKVWKGRFRGQRQKWYCARFLGEDADVNIATRKPEFDRWRWAPAWALPELIVPFKRQLYADILERFAPTLRDLGAVTSSSSAPPAADA